MKVAKKRCMMQRNYEGWREKNEGCSRKMKNGGDKKDGREIWGKKDKDGIVTNIKDAKKSWRVQRTDDDGEESWRMQRKLRKRLHTEKMKMEDEADDSF